MDEIFKQYGSAIITVLSVTAVISIIVLVIGNDANSEVYKAFTSLITGFFTKAEAAATAEAFVNLNLPVA
ncbi:MAG: hypothetical protein K6E13_10675 [Lachnospiraceae bacterium]|nr:hypothetical protein [Lachnospiraceae bacterium]